MSKSKQKITSAFRDIYVHSVINDLMLKKKAFTVEYDDFKFTLITVHNYSTAIEAFGEFSTFIAYTI